MKDSFALPSNKLVYIYKLIVTTPHYGWVVVLQIISGFCHFCRVTATGAGT